MPADWTVRLKRPEDNEAAGRLVAEAFREKYVTIAGGSWEKALAITLDEMEHRGACENFFVAAGASGVIGAIEIISVEIPTLPVGEMLSIYFKHLGLRKGTRAAYLLSLLSRVIGREEACVSSLAVAGPARGAGVGKSLLTRGEEYAAEIGKKRLVLWVAEENETAIGLYKSHGFIKDSDASSPQLKRFFGLEAWLKMVKRIGA